MVSVSSFSEFCFNKYLHQTPMTEARNMPSEEFYFANSEQHSVSSSSTSDLCSRNYYPVCFFFFFFFFFAHFVFHISTLLKAPVGHWLTGRLEGRFTHEPRAVTL
jgi:hypothetical protein